MLTTIDLAATARARLKDALALFGQGQYDGATYICGYAVEIALKTRIVKTLKWPGFPSDNKEFAGLQSFKSHDLELLLYMCGREARIKARFPAEWLTVCQWIPEVRYNRPGSVVRTDSEEMIEATKKIIGALL